MVNIHPSALDIALERAQQIFDTTVDAKAHSVRGIRSDARDALNGNVADAKEKLFGKSGFVNSIRALPEEDRADFAQAALSTVNIGSKGKNTSIELQTAFISNVIQMLDKLKDIEPAAFADTLKDDLRPTEVMPMNDSSSARKGPQISKASLEYAAGKALEAMGDASARREVAFREANKGIKDVTPKEIEQAFSSRLAEATDYMFNSRGSVMARLMNTQSAGEVKVILDSAYSELPDRSRTMSPVVEASLDAFVKALQEKEPNFSYQKPGRQR